MLIVAIITLSISWNGQNFVFMNYFNTSSPPNNELKSTIPLFFSLICCSAIILSIIFRFTKQITKTPLMHNFELLLGATIFIIGLGFTKILLMLIDPALDIASAQGRLYFYYLPLFSSSLCAILYGVLMKPSSSFIFLTVLSLCQTIMYGGELMIFLVSMFSAATGVIASNNARRRTHLIRSGLQIGLVQSLFILSHGMLMGISSKLLVIQPLTGIMNGSLGAFFAAGLSPMLEYMFKVTTDIRLLELSDLNHPLLKKLVMDAPGTYHHSLIVGNLAESAAEVVGAKPLLARVGAYFHDIGKIKKPEYFSENEWSGKSRHDDLIPSMSSLIIISHVKDGVDLAKKYGLNKDIVDIIEQHHGTSLVYFFYKRAQKIIDEDQNSPKEEEYRYPGPAPKSKEAAIILLADAVEASSRSLDNPTPSRIKNLVDEIINSRFLDSQLNNCELTIQDLANIKECFTFILTGIFHTRPKYPKEQKQKEKNNGNSNKQPSEEVQDSPAGD